MKKRFVAWLTIVCIIVMICTPAMSASAEEVLPQETQIVEPAPEVTAEVPTAEPTVEVTEAPTAEPTVEVTEAPTAEPTVEATEAPTAEPTVEVPAEISLMSETDGEETEVANAEDAEASEESTAEEAAEPAAEVTEAPTAEPTVEVTEAPTAEPTVEVTEAPTAEPTVEVTEAPTAEPTVEVTEAPTAEPTVEATEAPTAAPEVPALSVGVSGNARYVVAGNEIVMNVKVSGGIAPYTLNVTVTRGSEVMETKSLTLNEAGSTTVGYTPKRYGDYKVSVAVVDAAGVEANASAVMPVAVKTRENEEERAKSVGEVELTGDWREDLLTVALTQIGYEESRTNFIVDEAGNRQGYTRYGDHFDRTYEEWCAMFVFFCMDYAQIPEEDFPRADYTYEWKDVLKKLGAYEDNEDKYVPVPGDIVFFNHNGGDKPQHIGIVYEVTEEKLITIEGNSNASVKECEYEWDNEEIIGYGNVTMLMDRAGMFETVDAGLSVAGLKAYTAGERINVRAEATASSKIVFRIDYKGVEVKLLGAKSTGDVIWYHIRCGEGKGYIRGDLLKIEGMPAPTADPTAEPTVEPTADPTAEPTVEPTADPTAEPTIEPTAEPTTEPTVENVTLAYEVEGAVSYEWQRGAVDAEGNVTEWIAIAGEASVEVAKDMEGMKYVYRCVAKDAEGAEIISEETTLIDRELVDWMNATEVTEEMLERAMNAKSLESLVFEGEEVIYVRTGKVIARYDEETGYIIDAESGMIVAWLDKEQGMFYPITAKNDDAE